MKVLFIGGTGNISATCSRLAVKNGIDLYHMNRGKVIAEIPAEVKTSRSLSNFAANRLKTILNIKDESKVRLCFLNSPSV